MIGALFIILLFCLYQVVNHKDVKVQGRYGWVSVIIIWTLLTLTGLLGFWTK